MSLDTKISSSMVYFVVVEVLLVVGQKHPSPLAVQAGLSPQHKKVPESSGVQSEPLVGA